MTDTVTIEDVPTLLERSLAVIRERGLTKNALVDPAGRVCARGAIMAALGAGGGLDGGWSLWREHAALVRPAERLLGDAAFNLDSERNVWSHRADPDYVVEFNNRPETTQEEMEAVYEAAIAAARGPVNGG